MNSYVLHLVNVCAICDVVNKQHSTLCCKFNMPLLSIFPYIMLSVFDILWYMAGRKCSHA